MPPHHSMDCAIYFLPDAAPPKGRTSQPESDAMKNYINEEISKGFIRPSTSPASAGFFFVKKNDGGLCPCIDYHSLNDITVKFRYPLPPVPAALKQLRKAKLFSKLDLRNAYNLFFLHVLTSLSHIVPVLRIPKLTPYHVNKTAQAPVTQRKPFSQSH